MKAEAELILLALDAFKELGLDGRVFVFLAIRAENSALGGVSIEIELPLAGGVKEGAVSIRRPHRDG